VLRGSTRAGSDGNLGERRATTTGRLDPWIVELKASASEALDVVDGGADKVHKAHFVNDDFAGLELVGAVQICLVVEVEVVGKPCTAATYNA